MLPVNGAEPGGDRGIWASSSRKVASEVVAAASHVGEQCDAGLIRRNQVGVQVPVIGVM